VEFKFTLISIRTIFGRYLTESVQIIWAVFIDTFVNSEMLAILLLLQSMPTIGTHEGNGLKTNLSPDKPVVTNFTQQLPAATGIIVEVGMRSTTIRAYAIGRDRVLPTRIDRLETLAVFNLVLLQQKDIVQGLKLLDDWKLINGKFVVLRACNIIPWRL